MNNDGDQMTSGLRLDGVRARDGAIARVEAVLVSRENDNCWRAQIRPQETIAVGDRLRFGETRESLACMLGFLDAEVAEKTDGLVLLSFQFTGPALDEALERIGRR